MLLIRLRQVSNNIERDVGLDQALHDGPEVRQFLSLSEDRFWQTVAQLAVEVQLGEAEVGVGEIRKIMEGLVRAPLSRGHGFQEALESLGSHDDCEPRSAPPLRYPWRS